ncbi:Activating signal cointegrator 1 complex subunit 1 [Tetrabaena socialis]|uniref:Activating signal cointegrator 1 complex subunit 1 n=1 Tax=Tetrabaena socialis TaxID=47790 RepID=A0A2J8AI74_9CHLO|nr:Activating signal cointegrator 1 complex subunit 1 [Tetrabaena socialis]|eukprot:PNH12215.1 Activating signal cointegrator 1 complex subunit 1 [Tetrabaena socialis]
MADVLHCRLLRVGGRTYRVEGSSASTLPHQPDRGEHAVGASARWQQEEEGYEEAALAAAHVGEDEIDESLVQQEGNQFVARLSCDAEVYPFLIGREGRTRKRIEAEAGVQLTIPRPPGGGGGGGRGGGGGGGDVLIRGPTRAAVSSGYLRTEVVMHEAVAVRLLDYNYFISLPLAAPAAVRQFEAFRRAALADPGAAASGLHESCFMAPQHLHVTLVMLKLYSDQKRHAAQQVHDMGPGSRLEALCDLLVDQFAQAGLLLPQDERKVKLHATVVNTRYRKRAPGGAGAAPPAAAGGRQQQQREERQPFDGRALLAEHARLDLGIHCLEAAHLSQRGVYGPDGYYRCAGKLSLAVADAAAETDAAGMEEES